MNTSKPKMSKLPDYPVPALEKGLDIIETLSASAFPMSLAELAVELKRSSSELFRMLNCLEQRGYITRAPGSGKYGPSLKLFALAHMHSPTEKLLQAARRPMQTLTEKFSESCHLSVLDRGRLLVIAQQDSPERVRLSIEVGALFDPVLTASGRLLLAQYDDAERADVLAQRPASRGAKPALPADFDSTLATIRRTGVSTAESETIEGVRDLAVLVGGIRSSVIAALAVTRLIRRGQRADDAALLTGMKATAAEITHALGLSV